MARRVAARAALIDPVTLVVYGWTNAQPGTLSWVFPSVGAALNASRAMKNAAAWAIVSGVPRSDDLEQARAYGAVLIENVRSDTTFETSPSLR